MNSLNQTQIHPTLRSLWNIPHIIRIPDPMPSAPDVLKLIQQRIVERRIEKLTLDPHLRDYQDRIFDCDQTICILEHKIEELHRAFPDLNDTQGRAGCPQPAASVNQTSENQDASSVPTLANPEPNLPNASQNIFAQNGEQSETTVANQHSSGETEVRQGETDVRLGETRLTSSETNSPNAEPKPLQTETPGQPEDQDAPDEDSNSPAGQHDDEIEENDEEEDDEEIDLSEYLDDEAVEAALDLQDYLSGRSPLDTLEPQKQKAILQLMEDYEIEHVLQVISQPPPCGFDIETSRAALYRFRKRYARAEEDCLKAKNAKAVEDLMAKANDSDEAFQAAVQRVLKARLLGATTEPNADLQTIDALITSLTKLRKQNLAERKQTHAEKIKNQTRDDS